MNALEKAHYDTDNILEKTEKEIHNAYNASNKRVNGLLSAFNKKFGKVYENKLNELESGLITKREYKEFMLQNVFLSKEWKTINKKIATHYTNLNKIELDKVNEKLSEIYAINYNAVQKSVKKR